MHLLVFLGNDGKSSAEMPELTNNLCRVDRGQETEPKDFFPLLCPLCKVALSISFLTYNELPAN